MAGDASTPIPPGHQQIGVWLSGVQAADLLMQRFKAMEKSLESGGNWKLARHSEITKNEDTLVSVEEELAAAKEELHRAKLRDGR